MAIALTIAGSDSGGGAGIQADLKTFGAFGVYGTCAITAVTAQNTTGVTAWSAVEADLVEAQIEAVAGDFAVGAVKTGMLATSAIVEAVAATVAALELPNLVVDPVMVAKGGHRLLDDDAVHSLRSELLPRAMIVTPNIPEAEVLIGGSIRTVEEMRAAARRIRGLGPTVVIVKGGHFDGDSSIDVVCAAEEEFELTGPRIRTRHTHGTGCTFSAAIAAGLALGRPVADAVRDARAYVAGAIEHAPGYGAGHGPLNHFWRLAVLPVKNARARRR
ncbi:MAG TPA: bifunctional hydroxymethylpyrimidine kinase/phosphomethylpyrimidine kinase [Vicinamibacterales bacterium]|jgi:hydroxymethylpyrimidine/phosphomethylpyrimidine kinase|nr:bifunctional hydroxymethylpyrimidine kinase/phosphomethylpyrimidine kinase [Vicinamibacterales bacterium]